MSQILFGGIGLFLILQLSFYHVFGSYPAGAPHIPLLDGNCNEFYHPNDLTLAAGQKLDDIQVFRPYLEIEFDININTLCADVCDIFRIGDADPNRFDYSRFPRLFITNYTTKIWWSASLTIGPGLFNSYAYASPDNVYVTVGSHHIYMAITPNVFSMELDNTTNSVNVSNRIMPNSQYPLHLVDPMRKPADATLYNICIRSSSTKLYVPSNSSNAAQSTSPPIEIPSTTQTPLNQSAGAPHIPLLDGNCNEFYHPNDLILATGQKLDDIQVFRPYLEIEFDININTLCDDFGEIFRIGDPDPSSFDFSRFPLLYTVVQQRFGNYTTKIWWRASLTNGPSLFSIANLLPQYNNVEVTVGAHHIYIAITPNLFSMELDNSLYTVNVSNRIIPNSQYPLNLVDTVMEPADATLHNICIRSSATKLYVPSNSSNAVQSTSPPTEIPSVQSIPSTTQTPLNPSASATTSSSCECSSNYNHTCGTNRYCCIYQQNPVCGQCVDMVSTTTTPVTTKEYINIIIKGNGAKRPGILVGIVFIMAILS